MLTPFARALVVDRDDISVQMNLSRSPVVAPRFASVGGGYDALLAPPIRHPTLAPPVDRDHRRCSSVTCSSTGSSYLERRGSAMAMPCLPPPPSFPRHAEPYDGPWDLYYPIDIQVHSMFLHKTHPFGNCVRSFLISFASPFSPRSVKLFINSPCLRGVLLCVNNYYSKYYVCSKYSLDGRTILQ